MTDHKITALAITEGGLLEPRSVCREADGQYYCNGQPYKADPCITTTLMGWFGEYETEAIGLVDARHPDAGPEFWIKAEDL